MFCGPRTHTTQARVCAPMAELSNGLQQAPRHPQLVNKAKVFAHLIPLPSKWSAFRCTVSHGVVCMPAVPWDLQFMFRASNIIGHGLRGMLYNTRQYGSFTSWLQCIPESTLIPAPFCFLCCPARVCCGVCLHRPTCHST